MVNVHKTANIIRRFNYLSVLPNLLCQLTSVGVIGTGYLFISVNVISYGKFK